MAESNVLPPGTFVEWEPERPIKRKVLGWIIAENGCHIWQGCRHRGYAMGRSYRQQKASTVYRLRYLLEVGPIPDGYDLDHYICDNGPGGCCNPHHCRPTTRLENALRSDVSQVAVNKAKTHCPHGHVLPATWNRRRRCATCTRIRVEKWTADNREHVRAYHREYNKTHTRRRPTKPLGVEASQMSGAKK